MPSIVRFGFVLLESMEEGSHKELCKCDGLMGSQELGTQMLKCLFEVHDMARNEVSIKCSSERYLFNWLITSVSSCFMGNTLRLVFHQPFVSCFSRKTFLQIWDSNVSRLTILVNITATVSIVISLVQKLHFLVYVLLLKACAACLINASLSFTTFILLLANHPFPVGPLC